VWTFSYIVEEDVRQLENFRARGFNRILKAGLKANVLEWHRRYASVHFTRRAYTRYAGMGLYRQQKRTGDPFVESGSLRERMLRPRTQAEVTGTSKQVTLRLPIGRPPQYTDEGLKRQVLIEMRKHNISYRQAQRRVYAKAQYTKETRELLKTHIPAVAGQEPRHLRAHLRDFVVRELNKHGRKRRRRVRA